MSTKLRNILIFLLSFGLCFVLCGCDAIYRVLDKEGAEEKELIGEVIPFEKNLVVEEIQSLLYHRSCGPQTQSTILISELRDGERAKLGRGKSLVMVIGSSSATSTLVPPGWISIYHLEFLFDISKTTNTSGNGCSGAGFPWFSWHIISGFVE